MSSRLHHTVARWAVRATCRYTGLLPIDRHEADDVFVVGFPKSGNTWLQYLLAGVLCGLDASRCPDALVQDLIPDVHDRLAYRRYTRPVFFKSHALPRPDYRRVIHLVRDGRDAMVSYHHHYQALYGEIDLLTLVRTAPDLLAKWHVHTEAWLANPHAAAILLMKYEDLHRDPLGELQKLCAFAALAADDAVLGRAIEQASFSQMRAREQRLGWDTPSWPKDRAFVRRGAVGSHRDEMTPEAQREFLAEAAPTLRKLGYAT
ncbi:MAG TPA: sulfotransferase domain-containing protein [Opitutaceae bacterium]|nr:sulfotransferase domain-containing protein [Opitutaceae bacterium]